MAAAAESTVLEATKSLLKTSPLHHLHVQLGAKFGAFAGYRLPLQYAEGVSQSVLHTRSHASLFDTSHMGQLRLHGKDSLKLLEFSCPGDIAEMRIKQSKLVVFTNELGGVVDDSIITAQEGYYQVVVNAANITKDVNYLKKNIEERGFDAIIEMEERALIALQGPSSMKILQNLVSMDLSTMKFMTGFIGNVSGVPDCYVVRCGYTGEDGFEISIPKDKADLVASSILSNNEVKPAGLAARDALRLEAGLCLYGNDLDESTTPIEAGLSWLVGKRRRILGDFLGGSKVLQQLREGAKRKRIGFKTKGAPVRAGAKILLSTNEAEIGCITSGGFSPTLRIPIAMGYIATPYSQIGEKHVVRLREKIQPLEVTKLPFCPTAFYTGPK